MYTYFFQQNNLKFANLKNQRFRTAYASYLCSRNSILCQGIINDRVKYIDIAAIVLHLLLAENTQVIVTYIKMFPNFVVTELVLVCTEFLNIQRVCTHLCLHKTILVTTRNQSSIESVVSTTLLCYT